MIKANAPEKKKATVKAPEKNLEAIRSNFSFPVNAAHKRHRKQITDYENAIRRLLQDQESYGHMLKQAQNSEKEHQLVLDQLRLDAPKEVDVATIEEVKEYIDQIAELPWVQSVVLDGTLLRIFTEPGVLKTVFDSRVVNVGQGMWGPEFIDPPIEAPLPQYLLQIKTSNMGETWTTNSSLTITLVNPEDTALFVAGKVLMQDMQAHWASNSNGRFGSESYLCLGEYDKDLMEASAKGIIPFLNELATYLQTSTDEHAYRRKEVWAAALGKPEYAGFCIRVAEKGETRETLEKKRREEFKKYRQPKVEGKEVDGTGIVPGSNVATANRNTVANGFITAGTFNLQETRWHDTYITMGGGGGGVTAHTTNRRARRAARATAAEIDPAMEIPDELLDDTLR